MAKSSSEALNQLLSQPGSRRRGQCMVRITIPPKLSALLEESPLADPTRSALNLFAEYLSNPNTAMYFFPEYTDHSKDHIESVLAASEALIHVDAWHHVTPNDAAVLI